MVFSVSPIIPGLNRWLLSINQCTFRFHYDKLLYWGALHYTDPVRGWGERNSPDVTDSQPFLC